MYFVLIKLLKFILSCILKGLTLGILALALVKLISDSLLIISESIETLIFFYFKSLTISLSKRFDNCSNLSISKNWTLLKRVSKSIK
ncbi:hypothetical protein [Mycoplasma capricolum]|uniref:hypothetical protein n=1 Tax=Mycoplasma capricolum TaxID=2095 RepID=UPI0004EF7D29|nr:hypothetical protein [Mycoplasma capricolum]WGD33195.1 hypothetical protein Mccp14020TZ_07130 [Mycoplasma capricolum subsp. capripneumoniae]CEA11069.1 hypothetical protein MCCPILRI181_00710 [Mycoplasma capricolum subsp. capripneumoniae]CEA12064.1 hypothetical protein MCCPF38_00707 [Mycoplasma capricolum subsp. capripneumoniae]